MSTNVVFNLMLRVLRLLVLLTALAARLALGFVWIFTPYVERAFGSFIWPLLGIIFLPWTTLVFTLAWNWGGHGVRGLEWLWVGLAVLVDIATAYSVLFPWFQRRTADTTRMNIGKFLVLTLELSLVVLVIRHFEIESYAVTQLSLLVLAGFVVHHLLPLRHRLRFFLFLSLVGIGLILGLRGGAWLIGIGLLLIGMCHLPIPFAARVGVLIAAGAALAALRSDWIHTPWSSAIWPILGSMFMFRLIIYLYDLSHDHAPTSVARTLSYFFLLPNVCFPLFPVVDYKTFRRTYYNEDSWRIYQRGVEWMARGVIHLLIYRLVYHNATLPPSEVANAGDLARYLIATFLLYLRVSGQFHLIVGMLHLFGFNLPVTHHLYYLAGSFTDVWRRINIYWKDFMLKIFYYPCFFTLRQGGATRALVVSTVVVFVATWFLHSYQWFWLRGSFPLRWQDGLFWGALAGLVVVNSIHESRHGRERTLSPRALTFRGALGMALRTGGTFVAICILWSLWNSESPAEWAALWAQVLVPGSWAALGGAALVVLGVALGGVLLHRVHPGRDAFTVGAGGEAPSFYRAAALTGASMALILLVGLPQLDGRLGSTGADVVGALRNVNLNRQDAILMERGYYEDLVNVDRFNSELWERYTKRPNNWLGMAGSPAWRWTNDLLHGEPVPSAEIVLKGAILRTNRWGMRDKEYELDKPPATYRIALLGSSHTMGSGVANTETYEAILEDRLNRENDGRAHSRYEILNFAVAGYGPFQQLLVLERKAFAFDPDAVYYAAHNNDLRRVVKDVVYIISSGADTPYYSDVMEIARKAGVTERTSTAMAAWRLAWHRAEVASWVYRRIVSECRARGIVPVWVLLPVPGESPQDPVTAEMARLAADAGFVVVNLMDVFERHDARSLRLADWDYHTNAEGHRLIAERLHERVKGSNGLLGLK